MTAPRDTAIVIRDCSPGDQVYLDDGPCGAGWYRVTNAGIALVRRVLADRSEDCTAGPWAISPSTPVLFRERSKTQPAGRSGLSSQAVDSDPLLGWVGV